MPGMRLLEGEGDDTVQLVLEHTILPIPVLVAAVSFELKFSSLGSPEWPGGGRVAMWPPWDDRPTCRKLDSPGSSLVSRLAPIKSTSDIRQGRVRR
jgi:hypothetical protein